MASVLTGNLYKEEIEKPQNKGWFIAHFIKEPELRNEHVEVKWSTHKKGWSKGFVAANKNAKSVSVLISGRFVLNFPDDGKEVVLSEPGDYCFWSEGVYHSSAAPEESVVLTLRWPSIPDDVVTRS